MQTPPRQITPLRIEACRGASGQGCKRLLFRDDTLIRAIEAIARDLDWEARVRAQTGGRILHHHAFGVAVSGCANGCSRPHIADLGLIPAREPALDESACDRCQACVGACREGAITLEDGQIRIDRAACLRCGDCLAACPTGALACGREGYRVLVGGKLGRRPALGRELPGLYSAQAAAEVLRLSLELALRRVSPEIRFAAMVAAAGKPFFAALEELAT